MIDSYNDGLPSHLKSGHDPAPKDLIDAAKSLSIDEIDVGFDKYVVPLIHNEKHEALVRAIRAILREDTTILGSTVVGVSPGFERDSILNYNSFDESALLANVVTYAILSTENNKMKASIREIGTGYVDGFMSSTEELLPRLSTEISIKMSICRKSTETCFTIIPFTCSIQIAVLGTFL